MPTGRPLYEPNPAARLAGHSYDIERLKRRLGPTTNGSPRIVFGQIDGSSTTPLDPGSGDWTVDTDYAGTWTITIDPPFSVPPAVHATENGSIDPPNWVQVASRTVDTIVIKTYDRSGALADDIGFDFDAKALE